MIAALSLALLFAEDARPPLPAGHGPEFFRAAGLVHEKLAQGDWAGATRRLRLLPQPKLTVAWDDAGVPERWRPAFAKARDEAIQGWTRIPNGPKITMAKTGDVVFRFRPKLGEGPVEGGPLGAATFFSDSLNGPRLEVVVGLSRGRPAQDVAALDVRNEVTAALALYFGLGGAPGPGTAAARTDGPSANPIGVTPGDAILYGRLQAYGQALRAAIKAQDRWPLGRARLYVDPPAGEATRSAEQGELVRFSFQITNTGDAPLEYRTQGDCSCVVAVPSGTVPPGGSVVIQPALDTTDFTTPLDKRLIVTTNDPDRPSLLLPLRTAITPRYLWGDAANGTILLGDAPEHEAVFTLDVPEAQTLDWNMAMLDGMEGDFEVKDLGVTNGRRRYEARVFLKTAGVQGRRGATLSVPTGDPKHPSARYSFFAQKGIVALPGDLYLGTLGDDVRRYRLLVSRPGRPFRITDLKLDTKALTAKWTDLGKGDEYRIELEYGGRAPAGELAGEMVIETDDPQQKRIVVPYAGARG